MKKEFDFTKARRVTHRETMVLKKAIEDTFNIKRPSRGRPPKGKAKYRDVHIRIHPVAFAWAHAQAKIRSIGYQTYINEVLLNNARSPRTSHK